MNDNLPRYETGPYQGQLMSRSWPGLYPIYYVCADNGVLCPTCANKLDMEIREGKREPIDPECRDDDQWRIVGAEANDENPQLFCDHCNERIPSAYAEDHEVLCGQGEEREEDKNASIQ